MHFYGYNAHVRTPLDELSAKLTKIGSSAPFLTPKYPENSIKRGYFQVNLYLEWFYVKKIIIMHMSGLLMNA